jgi:hypothetical protein
MDYDKTLDAIWCTDSETGEQLLIDRHTGEVLARKDTKGEIIYAN